LVATMLDAGAPAATTTSGGLIEALRVLGLRRIAVVTPYIDSVTQRLLDLLGEYGIEVVSHIWLGLLDHRRGIGYRELMQSTSAARTCSRKARGNCVRRPWTPRCGRVPAAASCSAGTARALRWTGSRRPPGCRRRAPRSRSCTRRGRSG